jgi:hypothetical protein
MVILFPSDSQKEFWQISVWPAIQTLLPSPVPVHHLGLFREPTTLEPVEYYNNLPYHRPAMGSPSNSPNAGASELAILLDPVIATGGTCSAAIQTLREWGVKRVIVVAVLGALPGLVRAANEWPEGVQIYVAGVDEDVNDRGMIKPGLGDVGDRLFLTIGKWRNDQKCLLEVLSTVGVGGYLFGRKPRFDETELRTLQINEINETKMEYNFKIKSEVHVISVLIYQYTVV